MDAVVDDQLLTVPEVAARLGVSTYTVTSWLRTGRLRGRRPDARRAGWRIEASEVQRFIAEQKGQRQEG